MMGDFFSILLDQVVCDCAYCVYCVYQALVDAMRFQYKESHVEQFDFQWLPVCSYKKGEKHSYKAMRYSAFNSTLHLSRLGNAFVICSSAGKFWQISSSFFYLLKMPKYNNNESNSFMYAGRQANRQVGRQAAGRESGEEGKHTYSQQHTLAMLMVVGVVRRHASTTLLIAKQ